MSAGVLDPLIGNLAEAEAKLNRLHRQRRALNEQLGEAEHAVNDCRDELYARVNEHVEQTMRGNE